MQASRTRWNKEAYRCRTGGTYTLFPGQLRERQKQTDFSAIYIKPFRQRLTIKDLSVTVNPLTRRNNYCVRRI